MTAPTPAHTAMTDPPDAPQPLPPDQAAAAENEPRGIPVGEPHNVELKTGQSAAMLRRTGTAARTAVADNLALGLLSTALVALMIFAFTILENRIAAVDNRLNAFADRVDARFDAQDARIDARFDAQDAKIDARFHAQDAKIDRRIDSLDTRIDRLDTKIDDLKTKIDTRIDTLDAKVDDLALKLTALIAALEKTGEVEALGGGITASAPSAAAVATPPTQPL